MDDELEANAWGSEFAVERLMQERLLQFLQGGEFAFVEAGEVLAVFKQTIECANNPLLIFKRRDDVEKLSLFCYRHLVARRLSHYL